MELCWVLSMLLIYEDEFFLESEFARSVNRHIPFLAR